MTKARTLFLDTHAHLPGAGVGAGPVRLTFPGQRLNEVAR